MYTCRPGSSRGVECASPAAADLEMDDAKPSHEMAEKRKMRVLVMGDEAADVAAFLRAASNSTHHKRIVTLSSAAPPLPLDLLQPSRAKAAAGKTREEKKSSEVVHIAVWESSSSTSTPTTTAAADDSDSSSSSIMNHDLIVFEFHQLLNVNPFQTGRSRYGKYVDGGTDPLDVHSGIRAQLNMDFPANANTKDEWDKWWDDHGIHLCILILSTTFIASSSADHRNGLLRHFFSRYYGLHSVVVPAGADNEVAACSPVPLLIILRGRSPLLWCDIKSEIKATITDVLLSAINNPEPNNYSVIDWPVEAEEEAAVCEYVKQNLLLAGGVDSRAASTEVRVDGISRQYRILQNIWGTAGIPTSSKFSCPWLHVPPASISGASDYWKWMVKRCFELLHERPFVQSIAR